MYFALIAVLLDAVYIIGTRKLLAFKKRVNYGVFLILLFLFLFIFSLVLIPGLGWINIEAINFKYLLLFMAMIGLSVWWNIIYYRSLHEERLVEFELVSMVYPLAAIFFAAVLIPKEFNIHVFVAGLVGALALLLAHIKRKHLSISKMQKELFLMIVLMALEAVCVDYLLKAVSPVSLYAIRTGVIFLVFLWMYRKNIKNIHFNNYILYSALLALVAVGFNVLCYESYRQIGVGFTILILILTPVLTFIYARYKEGELIGIKKILAILIIILSIVYAYLLY